MKEQVNVSVIVPVFQVYPYIDRCLESICRQTETDIEVICVYTESRDGTFQKLEAWAKRDARIRIIRRDDGGLGGARNTGMQHARGRYIAFVDSDDWLEETMLQTLEEVAQSRCCDVVICPFRSFDDTKQEFLENAWGSRLPFPDALLGRAFTLRDLSPALYVSPDAPVTAWNKLYRSDFLQKAQLSFPENCRYEDNPFYYELMAKARIGFVQEPYYNYRVNRAGSLQASGCMDESVFDIIRVMKGIADMLCREGVGEGYRQEFTRYMLSEFSWRFQSLRGNKRRFLSAVRAAFPESLYGDFLETLGKWGEDIGSALFYRIPADIPQVSVIIPVYNNERDIAQCLDSVLSQKDIRLEVYAVDDCSRDHTADILDAYAAKDKRVHVIQKRENTGAGLSRELALKEAAGEFVFFLDGDDLLPQPDVLNKMYSACKKHRKLTCAGNMQCFYNNDPSRVSPYSGDAFSEPGERSYENYFPHPSWGFTRFLYNLEVILENDIHFPEWRYYEDPLFFVRYMSAEKEFYAIADPVYLYRQKQNMQEVFSRDKFFDLFASLKLIFPLLSGVGRQVYYAEYHTLLQFCAHLHEYLKDDPASREKLVSGADDVFQLIDFSAYAELFPQQDIYRSYEQFEGIQYPAETSSPPAPAGKEEEKKGMGGGAQEGKEKRPGLLRRLLKKLLKPFYQPFRHRYEAPLWETREYASGAWRNTARLLQQADRLHQPMQEAALLLRQQQGVIAGLQEQQGALLLLLEQQSRQHSEMLAALQQQLAALSGLQQQGFESVTGFLQEIRQMQQKGEETAAALEQHADRLQGDLFHKLDLIEISVNGQEKWDAQQIQKKLFNIQFLCERFFGREADPSATSSIYGNEFYDDNRYESVTSGTEVFRLLLPILRPESVLDFGCGTGTWLYAARRFGVKSVHGVDGDYVDRNSLMIGREEFEPFDLKKPYHARQRYDMTISLEVAEHLDEQYADVFADTLCSSSDILVFSAAHPGQGGDGHLNEQPLEYWKEKIEARGFRHVEIRPLFQDNQKIAWWYRDNIALFIRGEDLFASVNRQIEELLPRA